MSTITLKPGLLVSLKTSIRGGITYEREELERSGGTDTPEVKKTLTTKVTMDPVETAQAIKVRGKLRSLISGVCVPSNFGLLCPVAKEEALNAAIKESRSMAATANAGFDNTRVSVFVMVGRIAQSDEEAVRAVSSELRDLFDEMKDGIARGNAVDIRTAANKARPIIKMLDNGAAATATAALLEARGVATEIVKRLTKQESVADFIDTVKLKALDEARFAFLDLDDVPAETVAALPAEAREIDTDEEESQAVAQAVADDKSERKAATGYTGPELEV